jgi:hypothetical protein
MMVKFTKFVWTRLFESERHNKSKVHIKIFCNLEVKLKGDKNDI